MEESKDFDVFKNFGISSSLIDYGSKASKSEVYVIRQEKIKKNFSDGAIHKIPSTFSFQPNNKAKDDMDLYTECDQEYGVFGADADENHSFSLFNELECSSGSRARNAFDPRFANEKNDFDFSKNLYACERRNLKSVDSITPNARLNSRTCEIDSANTNYSQGLNLNVIEAFRNTENDINNNNKNINNQDIFIVNTVPNKPNTNNDFLKFNSQSLCNEKDAGGDNKFTESNQNYFKKIAQIESKKEPNPGENKTLNQQKPENDLLLKNGIIEDSMRNQMQQLDKLFQEMNETTEAKVIIKAYKSKLKTKFYKIYESNSEFYKEKNKFRIFHKCNFPGCSRTFASAGWLRIHFNEHLKEIQNTKFNVEFEKSLLRLKRMNLLK